MNIGSCKKERGELDAARVMLAQNFWEKRRVLGSDHLDTCLAAMNLVRVWCLAGRCRDAQPPTALCSACTGTGHPADTTTCGYCRIDGDALAVILRVLAILQRDLRSAAHPTCLVGLCCTVPCSRRAAIWPRPGGS